MLHIIHRGHTESGFFAHALFTQRHVQLLNRLPGNQRRDSDRYACIIPLLGYDRMHKGSEPDRWHYSDLEPEILSDIRAGRAILIFDLCNEGPALDEDIFAALLNWIEANELPAGRVIWLAQNRAMARSANEIFGTRSRLIGFESFDFFVRATAWIFSRDSTLPVLGTDIEDAIRQQVNVPHRDKILLCMNATPRLPRILTVAALIYLGLMKDSLVSFGGIKYTKEGIKSSDVYNFLDINKEFQNFRPAIDETLQIHNLRVDCFSEQGNALFDKIDPVPYQRTFFSLVTESEWSNGEIIRITEKTMKAFCMGHPTIIVGNPNSIKFATELGFMDWDNLFDRSHEQELNTIDRFNSILREIVVHSNKIQNRPEQWLDSARFVSTFNINHAMSGAAFDKYVSKYDIPLINYFKSLLEGNLSPRPHCGVSV